MSRTAKGLTMSKVEKVSLALTPTQAEALRAAVEQGEFASTSEAARQAVAEWTDRRDQRAAAAIEHIRKLWDEGLASGIAPRRRTTEEISAAGKRRLEQMRAQDPE
jgi:antitoxin ParD1/3/4